MQIVIQIVCSFRDILYLFSWHLNVVNLVILISIESLDRAIYEDLTAA